MPNLEFRLAKLEAITASEESPAFAEFVRRLPPLDTCGSLNWEAAEPAFRDVFLPWLQDLGASTHRFERLADSLERGLAVVLSTFEHSAGQTFPFEPYRRRIPDRSIAALYNERRNWVGPTETILRTRQLAGVLDEHGDVLPSYVLNANGCINDVPAR